MVRHIYTSAKLCQARELISRMFVWWFFHGKMNLNDAGIMVEHQWLELPQRFTNIQLHEYIVIPNHFDVILEIAGVFQSIQPLITSAAQKTTIGTHLIKNYGNEIIGNILSEIIRNPSYCRLYNWKF